MMWCKIVKRKDPSSVGTSRQSCRMPTSTPLGKLIIFIQSNAQKQYVYICNTLDYYIRYHVSVVAFVEITAISKVDACVLTVEFSLQRSR